MYWISAFAFSQWKLDAHLPDDLPADESCLAKAMRLCDGTVSVVDKAGEVYFGRMWCVYEVGYSLQLGQEMEEQRTGEFLYDMYTCHSHRVLGELVEKRNADDEGTGVFGFFPGLTLAPKGDKEKPTASQTRYAVGVTTGLAADDRSTTHKMSREAFFPSAIFKAPLGVRLQAGVTAVESDRHYLLNSTRALETDGSRFDEPEMVHQKYSEMNALIRGYVARMSLVRTTIEYCQGATGSFEALLEGLRESAITRIDLTFGQAALEKVAIPPKVFDRLLENLPATVEHLVIECPPSVAALPQNRLKVLPHLHTIELTNSTALVALPDDIVECYSLHTLELSHLHALKELPRKLFELRDLRMLNLSSCKTLTSVVARLPRRHECKLETLMLTDCAALVELPETLGNNLVNLQHLQMRGCTALQAMPSWVPAMEQAGVAVQRPSHLS